MTKKIVIVLVLLFGCFPVPACRKETDEEKVKKIVAAVQHATEDKKLLAAMEHISKSYRDPQENDYNAIKGLFSFYFFRHRSVTVAIPSIEVAVSGPTATAQFTAVLSARGVDGESAGILLPDAMGAYDFNVSFRQEDKAWKVISATWTRVGEATAPRQ